MKPFIILFFLFFSLHAVAQSSNAETVNTQTPVKDGDSVYIAADFPGGVNEWVKFIEKNLRPETPANHRAPVGIYTVVASFAIDSAGNVTDIKILQDPGYGMAKDVTHLLSKSPKWLPATINDKPVLYRQKQNFTYQVNEQ